jgi:hypothetical protein
VGRVIGNMTLSKGGYVKTVENHIHIGIIRNQPRYLNIEDTEVEYNTDLTVIRPHE